MLATCTFWARPGCQTTCSIVSVSNPQPQPQPDPGEQDEPDDSSRFDRFGGLAHQLVKVPVGGFNDDAHIHIPDARPLIRQGETEERQATIQNTEGRPPLAESG